MSLQVREITLHPKKDSTTKVSNVFIGKVFIGEYYHSTKILDCPFIGLKLNDVLESQVPDKVIPATLQLLSQLIIL